MINVNNAYAKSCRRKLIRRHRVGLRREISCILIC
nr:MAG TPA: hypothetical protein [Caudoviricetes sp.]